MVSPPLLGSCGVVPLTIIAPLPDICQHMSNCIARAKREVFLATNYWKHSEATLLITNSLKELSRRAGERGEKVVVKVMYDRGNPKQVRYVARMKEARLTYNPRLSTIIRLCQRRSTSVG